MQAALKKKTLEAYTDEEWKPTNYNTMSNALMAHPYIIGTVHKYIVISF